MTIHEGSDFIYSNPRSKIVVEIVIIINTSMETQSSKIDIVKHGGLLALKSIVGWWNGRAIMVGWWLQSL